MSVDDSMLAQLEVLPEKLGVVIHSENVMMEESSGTGCLCRIDGKYVLFLPPAVIDGSNTAAQ